jgi:uncharacterized repeat protein (TIGR01451 family)
MPVPSFLVRRLSLPAALLALSATVLPGAAALAADEEGEGVAAVEATGSGPLEADILVQALEVATRPEGGEEKRFVEARKLQAGEEVYYTIRVRNPGKEAVADVVVTKRMPFGVDYVRGSASGPACDVEVSRDNGQTYAAEGKSGEYTHLRWTCRKPLAPGATALLRFRAIFR